MSAVPAGFHGNRHYSRFVCGKRGTKICRDEFEHFLLANGVQHVTVPKGEHRANGPAESGIGDIDRMSKAIMTDKNIPSMF